MSKDDVHDQGVSTRLVGVHRLVYTTYLWVGDLQWSKSTPRLNQRAAS